MTETVTRRILISGRVQGVGYRAWTAQTARKFALSGWVRNLTDGRVEALVHGPDTAVDAFVGACQAGPPIARVTNVDTRASSETVNTGSFAQRPTADPEE